jgi:NAD+ kinase
MMDRIGILYNPLSQPATKLGEELETWIGSKGVDTWRGVSSDAREDPAPLTSCSLLVCLGGDGTVLRAARLAIPHRTPLLPVALGHLSFMAEVTPEELRPAIERILADDFWIEERALADAWLQPVEGQPSRYTALNEILVGRGEIARAVVVEVAVDRVPMTNYHADGVIIATATGSTAYALAAGGPVLDPRSQALALVPVAAHLTHVPALVLHDTAEVTLTLRSRYAAVLSIDGQVSIPLRTGDILTVRRSERVGRFARVRSPQYFYQSLTQRLRHD